MRSFSSLTAPAGVVSILSLFSVVVAVPAPTASPTSIASSEAFSSGLGTGTGVSTGTGLSFSSTSGIYTNTTSGGATTVSSGQAHPSITHTSLSSHISHSSKATHSSNSTKSEDTASLPHYPKTGCVITTAPIPTGFPNAGDDEPICYCAGDEIAGIRVGASKTKTTTICATGGPMPTGYIQIPNTLTPPGVNAVPADGPCANGDSPDEKCWGDLSLGTYVSWWWNTFNSTCGDQAFAECFYSQQTRYAPSNCAQLNTQPACVQPQWADFENKWNGVYHFYIAWTIWNINGFFSDYYTAITAAQATATDSLGSIINTIDPQKTTNFGLGAALTALSAGLAFIPGAGAPIAAALTTAAQQAPGVAKFIWPTGNTASSQMMDWDNISGSLGVLATMLQGNVSQAVPAIQNDVSAFNAVASSGVFTGELPPLDSLKTDILIGLNTFVISEAYKSQTVFVVRSVDTDVSQLTTNGSSLTWDIDCGSYAADGTCEDFFYDGDARITYGLVKGNGMGHRFDKDLTQWFNAQSGSPMALTSGKQLLGGANTCQQTTGGSGPIVDAQQGSFSVPCLSSMKVCTWGMTSTGPGDEGDGLFTDCDLNDVMPTWKHGDCEGDPVDYGGSVPVPWTYLGWGETANSDNGYHGFCQSNSQIW